VRKAAEAVLRIPTFFQSFGVRPDELHERPPVFVNSIPKSGTHLLLQVVEGLPDRVNYGRWVASMTSSFRFRERTPECLCRLIHRMLPGEIVRGHLFFDPRYLEVLAGRKAVNYFIYRDPRDMAISSAHYARTMNPWHRLHKYYRNTTTLNDAITIAIGGLQPPVPGVDFPDAGQRFRRYRGWIDADECFAIRFEDLQSDNRENVVRRMAEFYAARCRRPLDLDACVASMLDSIAPTKSHTFRSGKTAGWRKSFTPEHRRLFHEVAGDLLIELGYEKDASWVDAAPTGE
jgi:hypothetical protein